MLHSLSLTWLKSTDLLTKGDPYMVLEVSMPAPGVPEARWGRGGRGWNDDLARAGRGGGAQRHGTQVNRFAHKGRPVRAV